jgi:CRP-like cAMP-binding protein
MARSPGPSALDRRQIQSAWNAIRHYRAGAALAATADQGARQLIVVSGWACEIRRSPDGRRQIVSFVLPGDALDLGVLSPERDVHALTRLEAIEVARLLPEEPVGRAEVEEVVQQAIRDREDRVFDQMVRLGRMNAKERVLNLLLEFHDRLSAVGLTNQDTFRLPLTQEVFADALGLSLVHVNRTLSQLRGEGKIVLGCGEITILRPQTLAEAASYLRRPEGRPLLSAMWG